MKKQLTYAVFSLLSLSGFTQTINCAPSVAAHRGFSAFYPENTIPAFEACIREGADYVEGDIVFTADMELVMMHDETVDRTTNGTGPVASFTLAQLKELDAGFPDKFDTKFSGTRVPTLGEALDLVKANNTLFCFELKVPGVAVQVANLIREKGMTSQGIVQSFLPQELAILKAYAPEIPCLLLSFSTGLNQYIDYASSIGIEYYAPGGIPDQAELDYAHERNIKYWVYTVDDTVDMYQLMRMGIDGIFTNRPDRLEGMSKPLIHVSHDTLFANWKASAIQWKYNGQEIPNAHDSIYVAKKLGLYTFTAKNNLNCEYESPAFANGVTRVQESSVDALQLLVYANTLSLTFNPLLEPAHLYISDMLGRVMETATVASGQSSANVSMTDYPKGLYVLTFQSGNHKIVKKIMK